MLKRIIKILLVTILALPQLVVVNPAWAVDTTFSCGDDGRTYTVDTNGHLTSGYCTAASLTLDSSVVFIEYAVMNNWQIESLTIPASVITIADGAFYGLPKLETITVDASNTNFKTVGGVLMNSSEDRIIYYPSKLPSQTYNVPNTVLKIDNRAFSCLTYLEVVQIGTYTTNIDIASFRSCPYVASSLREINVLTGNSSYISINKVLYSADEKNLLNFPANYQQRDYVVPNGTLTIAGSAFENSNIRSITFPSSLTTIDSYAFQNARSLVTVGEFPASYTYSGATSPFFGADKVTSFSVSGDNLSFKSVGGVLFSKNGSILREYPGGKESTEYRIPDSVVEVDGQAIVNSYLKTLVVPSTLTTLGYSYISLDYLVFRGTSSVSQINGYNWVDRFIYCGATNSVINSFATSRSKIVECVDSYFADEAEAVAARVAAARVAAEAAAARVAAELAAVKAAAEKREAEKKSARSEISSNDIVPEKLSVETFSKADIPGVTAKNIDAVQAEILALPAESRADISQVLLIARKFEVVEIIASDRINFISSAPLVEIGLIPEDSKHKSTLVAALRKLPVTQRSNLSSIKVAIDTKLKEIQERLDRTAAIRARIPTRLA
jgi:hypothetical protein